MSDRQETTSREPSPPKDDRLPELGQISDGGESENPIPEVLEQMESPLPHLIGEATDLKDMEPSPVASPIATPTSSLPSPLLPLPDFMTALNMQLNAAQGAESEGVASTNMDMEEEAGAKMSVGPGSKEVLIEKFRRGELSLSFRCRSTSSP